MDKHLRYYFTQASLIVCTCFSLIISSAPAQVEQPVPIEEQIAQLVERLRAKEKKGADTIEPSVEFGIDTVPALMEIALRGPLPKPSDPEGQARRRAWDALVRIGEPAVLPLIMACGNEDQIFGANASKVLRDIGEPAKPYLIAAMEDKNPRVRRHVIRILGAYRDSLTNELLAALHDADSNVRDGVVLMFMYYHGDPDKALAVQNAMMEVLDYEHPYWHSTAIYSILTMWEGGGRLRLALALRDQKWSVRFGAAEAYAYAWHDAYRPTNRMCAGPLPTEVVPNLIEGLNRGIERGDMWLRETAVRALKRLNWAKRHAQQTLDNAQKAEKALEAFPPLTLLSSSVKDNATMVDITPLNRHGIRFDFSNSIDSGDIRIKKLSGELLDWEKQWNAAMRPGQKSDWITITPTPGNELVGGTSYIIELQDIKDFLGNLLKTQIRFTTKE